MIRLGRLVEDFAAAIHPVQQRGRLFAWEVTSRTARRMPVRMLIFGPESRPSCLGLRAAHDRTASRSSWGSEGSPLRPTRGCFNPCRPAQAAGPELRALSGACSAAVVRRCEAGQSEHAGHDWHVPHLRRGGRRGSRLRPPLVTPSRGLCLLGLPWLHARASALLGWWRGMPRSWPNGWAT
jgi:hypothetical protein